MARAAVFSLLLIAVSIAWSTDSGGIWVSITQPRDGDLAIGDVNLAADALSDAGVTEVEFRVDGRPVGVAVTPPYNVRVDLGGDNIAHRIEVVARDANGNVASDLVETAPLPVGGRFSVELQQLYVTATFGESRVLDLQAADFAVRDDGNEQELVTFSTGDVPFTAVLLLDASASMHGDKLEHALEGARAFVEGMQDLDQARLLVYSHRLLSSTPFTGVRQVLLAGLSGPTAEGGTAVNDHLFMALKQLQQRQGRRVVVLLSDGVDTHSVLTMGQVYDTARRCQALIYWIRLVGTMGDVAPDTRGMRMSSSWKKTQDYKDQFLLLQRAVKESGGRICEVRSLTSLREVFLDILQELREQYVLGYYPSKQENDGSWHKVRVKVARPNVEVRTHLGYVDL